jgi:glycosyltransferase involved in cell wall biosynthesis
MTSELDFSIVVPVHNQERHIEDCIQAMLALDYPPDRFEIIMVDNNSTDRSAEVIRRYPRVQLFQEKQQGDFAARNKGVAESKGAIIAFTDSDTAPCKDWLQSIAAVMRDPQIEVIIGYLKFGSGGLALSMLEEYEAQRGEFVFASGIKEIYYGYTCNQVVRRTAFDRLGAFPAVYRNSDTVFVRRVVDEYSCDTVCYRRDVRVRRLEVASFWAYLNKQHLYGRDFRRYAKLASVRTLKTAERFHVFEKARAGQSVPRSALLFLTLVAGVIAYELGRLRGIVSPS